MSLIYGMSLTALVPFCELGFSVWRFGLDACHNDIRGCAVCWQSFRPTREAQLYCSPRCRNLAKVRRHRSGYTVPPLPRYGRSGYRLSSLPLDGSQRFPRLVSIRMAPRPELYRATTTDSNIMRTAIPSCRHVSTEGRSFLSRKPRIEVSEAYACGWSGSR